MFHVTNKRLKHLHEPNKTRNTVHISKQHAYVGQLMANTSAYLTLHLPIIGSTKKAYSPLFAIIGSKVPPVMHTNIQEYWLATVAVFCMLI